MAEILLWSVFGVLSAAHVISCRMRAELFRRATKVLLMPALLAAALSHRAFSLQDNALCIAAALLCGTAGDFFLLHPERTKRFICGAACFFLGHLAWLKAYREAVVISAFSSPVFAVLYIVYGVFCVFMWFALNRPKGALGAAVVLYTLMLSLLHLVSITALLYGSAGAAGRLFFAGSSLFLLSDGILALSVYNKKAVSWLAAHDFWIMLTYTGAETCLTLGALLYL